MKALRGQITSRVPAKLKTVSPKKDPILRDLEVRCQDLSDAIENSADSESVTLDIARTLLKSLLGSLPHFESKLKDGSSRDVYAFVALSDMMLKLSNELRALQDRSVMTKIIMKKIIRPEFEVLANQITSDLNGLKLKLPKDTPRSVLDSITDIKQSFVISMSKTYSETGDKLSQYFGGNEGAFREELDVE